MWNSTIPGIKELHYKHTIFVYHQKFHCPPPCPGWVATVTWGKRNLPEYQHSPPITTLGGHPVTVTKQHKAEKHHCQGEQKCWKGLEIQKFLQNSLHQQQSQKWLPLLQHQLHRGKWEGRMLTLCFLIFPVMPVPHILKSSNRQELLISPLSKTTLCKAFAAVSEEPTVGTYQTTETFWYKIFESLVALSCSEAGIMESSLNTAKSQWEIATCKPFSLV